MLDLSQDAFSVVVGLSILVGALYCFLGYRIFIFVLGLTGFVLGAIMAGAIAAGLSQGEIVIFLAGLTGGLIGGTLMVLMYIVGVFLIGAFLGAAVAATFFATSGAAPDPTALTLLSILGGVVAVMLQKFMIVISTAFGGAWMMVTGIGYFSTGFHILDTPGMTAYSTIGMSYAMLISCVLLGILGTVVQYMTLPGTRAGETTATAPETPAKANANLEASGG